MSAHLTQRVWFSPLKTLLSSMSSGIGSRTRYATCNSPKRALSTSAINETNPLFHSYLPFVQDLDVDFDDLDAIEELDWSESEVRVNR